MEHAIEHATEHPTAERTSIVPVPDSPPVSGEATPITKLLYRPEPAPRFYRQLLGNRSFRLGLAILLPVIVLATLSAFVPFLPGPLESNVRDSLATPSIAHPFGADKLGRDILSRTLAGIRVSLVVGFSVAIIAMTGGLIIGTISGFMGRAVDRLIMSIVDVFLAFPSLLLAIGLVAILGAGIGPVIVAISVSDLPRFIRLQRSLVLSLKGRSFIDAARIVCAPKQWLMFRHILPNTIAQLLVAGSLTAAYAIIIEASLSFLGLGITPPAPSLGNIIADGQNYLQEAWWISTLPGVVLLLITFSLHQLSDGIRMVLDPRSRK